MGRALALALVALGVSAAAALACGVCVEDRVAAVYDHDVVERALASGHHVAFWALEGVGLGRPAQDKEIVRALDGIAGVARGSVRVSLPHATVSFAFDPARAPLPVLLGAARRTLASRGLTPTPLRVMDARARLAPSP